MVCNTATVDTIATLFFHPRLIKSLPKYLSATGRVDCIHTKDSHPHRVEFASSVQHPPAPIVNAKVEDWMHRRNLHVVMRNSGVIDETNSSMYALDVLLASPDEPYLVLCTLMLDGRASVDDRQRAYAHASKIHSTMTRFYRARCRSVLLELDPDNHLSEMWL
jgi:hypothetical protein